MKIKQIALCIAALLVFQSNVAAEYRLATIDMARIMNESTIAIAEKKNLDKLSLAAKEKVEAKRKTLVNLEKELKARGVKTDSKEAQDFRQKGRELTRLLKDSEEDLKREFLKANKKITSKVLAEIEKYAREQKFDLVLEKSDKTRGPILFGAPGADITDQIITKMNN